MTREEIIKNAKPVILNSEDVAGVIDNPLYGIRKAVKLPVGDCLEVDTDGSVIGVYNRYEGAVLDCMAYAPCQKNDILYVRETFAVGSVEYAENGYGEDEGYIPSARVRTPVYQENGL